MSPYIGYDSDTTFIPGTLNTSSSLTIQGGGITQTGGDVNFDSGTLFIDEDLNRVGIGTTTMGTTFEVVNASGNLAASLKCQPSGASTLYFASTSLSDSFIQYDDSGKYWRLFRNGSESLRITSAGVGIGTVNPLKKIHVLGGTSSGYSITSTEDRFILARFESEDARVQIASDNAGNNGSSLILSNDDYHWIVDSKAIDANNRFCIGYYNSNASDTDDWNQNKSDYLTILTTGNVGIGTTNPSTKLHIANGGLVVNANDAYQVSSVRTLLVRGGRARNTSISNEENAIKIWPGEARATTVGAYWGGISFNHLEPHTWASYGGSHLWIGGRFPQQGFPAQEYSDLVFATNGSSTQGSHAVERMCITYQGNVGIGITNPSDKLVIYNATIGNPTGLTIRNTEATSAYSHARLRLESQNATAYAEIWADVANSGLRMGYNGSSTVRIDSTGNVHVPSGAGIGFGATADASGATSELFDDYEEGTWTPQWGSTSGSFASVTYSKQSGNYTKVGNMVFIECRLSSSAISIGTASGGLLVTGLPFTVRSSQGAGGSPSLNGMNLPDGTVNVATETRENSNQFYAGLSSRDNTSWLNFTPSVLSTTGTSEIRVSFCYRTDT